MADETTYPKTATNTVNRYKHQATYDVETIHGIVNSCPFVHVSFVPDPSNPGTPSFPPPPTGIIHLTTYPLQVPTILPLIGQIGTYASSPTPTPHLYLHTSTSSRLATLARSPSGLQLCVAATRLSGLVLSLTPYTHNYNYSSAVLHGSATVLSSSSNSGDDAEILYAMELITNSVVPDRWSHTRVPPTSSELTSTAILKMAIESASGKVRAGGPEDERWDLKRDDVLDSVWTGVVPVYERLGEPVAGAYNRVTEVPGHVAGWVRGENERREREVVEGAGRAPPSKRGKRKEGDE